MKYGLDTHWEGIIYEGVLLIEKSMESEEEGIEELLSCFLKS